MYTWSKQVLTFSFSFLKIFFVCYTIAVQNFNQFKDKTKKLNREKRQIEKTIKIILSFHRLICNIDKKAFVPYIADSQQHDKKYTKNIINVCK